MSKQAIALVSSDKIGKSMAGPGIRYFELAKALSKYFRVTLIVPDKCDLEIRDVKILEYNSRHSSSSIANLVSGHDFVMSQFLRPTALRKLAKKKIRYIADLYDPQTVEVLEQAKYDTFSQQDNLFDFIYYSQALQIYAADFMLCSSEKQKDLYIGMMTAQRVINPDFYRQSSDLEKFIVLAPFGLTKKEPVSKNSNAMNEKFPSIKSSDNIIFWGGGIWNWFDPMSAIKAIERISKYRKDVKLIFLGVAHPNPKIDKMKIVEEVLHYCKEKDLLDKYVFFNFGWTPYEERTDFLLKSKIGISTHLNNLETRFSFRTRILDYLWAKLPIITTEGDSMSVLVEEKNLGKVVGYQNISEIEKSIIELIDDKAKVDQIKENIRKINKEFEWDTIAQTIARAIENNDFIKKKRSYCHFLKLSFGFYLAGFRKKYRYGK